MMMMIYYLWNSVYGVVWHYYKHLPMFYKMYHFDMFTDVCNDRTGESYTKLPWQREWISAEISWPNNTMRQITRKSQKLFKSGLIKERHPWHCVIRRSPDNISFTNMSSYQWRRLYYELSNKYTGICINKNVSWYLHIRKIASSLFYIVCLFNHGKNIDRYHLPISVNLANVLVLLLI